MSQKFSGFFLPKLKKKSKIKNCVLYWSFWSDWGLDMFSTSKWPSEPKFCERYYVVGKKMTRNGCKIAKVKGCLFYIEMEYK